MKCTGCGQKIAKDTEFCMHCGAKKPENKRVRPLYIGLAAGTLVTAVLITLLFTVILPLINYNTATTFFEGGAYETAGDKFRELGSYKDSVKMLAKSLYREGESNYEAGQFAQAIEPFSELAEMFPETAELVDDAQYMTGVALGVEEEYEDAADALEEVSFYRDADELIEAAQQQEQEAFIKEAISHELPLTEEEVVKIVDIATGQQDDAGSSLQETTSNPEWLIDLLCEADPSFDKETVMQDIEDGKYTRIKYNIGYVRQNGYAEEEYKSNNRIELSDGKETIEIELSQTQSQSAMSEFNRIFPRDYFDQLPFDYSDYLISYIFRGSNVFINDQTMPVFSVVIEELVPDEYTFDDGEIIDISHMIDIDNMIMDTECYKKYSGSFGGGKVYVDKNARILPNSTEYDAVSMRLSYQPAKLYVQDDHEEPDKTENDTVSEDLLEFPRTGAFSVSAGHDHAMFLKEDGTVEAVGSGEHGQCDVDGWGNIVAVSAGQEFSLGLKNNGTVLATGDNGYDQCEVNDWVQIVAISAGEEHSVGLKPDGTVVAVGNNDYGQCEVNDWTDIVAISAGGHHTVGLKSDGTVVATGDNKSNSCVVADWEDIIAVSTSEDHTVGLRSDGSMIAIGYNKFGQCEVVEWANIIAVDAGKGHTVGLKNDGTVLAVGYNASGQCETQNWSNIVAVSAGGYFTIGLKSEGSVLSIGGDGVEYNVSGINNVMLPDGFTPSSDEPSEPGQGTASLCSADWLIEAVCEAEGFSDFEELKAANDCDGELNYIMVQTDSTGAYYELEFGCGEDGFYLGYEAADIKALAEVFTDDYPESFLQGIPHYRGFHGFFYVFDPTADMISDLDLSRFDLSRSIFFAASTNGAGAGGEVPSKPEAFRTDEDYWSEYISSMAIEEIITMANLGEGEIRLLSRELVCKRDGYETLLHSESYTDDPSYVLVMFQSEGDATSE